jgi:hypothetical protein
MVEIFECAITDNSECYIAAVTPNVPKTMHENA